MNKLIISFLLLLSLAISMPVMASDKDDFSVAKWAPSCGEWVEARNNNQAETYKYWFAGYISAYNVKVSTVFNILGTTDMKSAFLWLDQYCLKEPLGSLVSGAISLTTELWPNRAITAPQRISQK